MKKISPISIAGISGLILSLIYLFFYLKKVDVSLFHYWQQSVPLSLVESLKVPGGISGLLADRILEFISEPLWGSMAVGLLVVIVFISLNLIFRKFKSNPFFYAFLIAALIPFILLFADFRLPFELVTSLTAGLLLAMFHSFYTPRNLALKLVFNFIIGLVVYVIAGVPGLLVLIQVIIVQAVISKRYTELLSVLPLLLLPLLYLPFNPSLTLKQACLGSFDISKYNKLPFAFYFSLFSPLLMLLVLQLSGFVFPKYTQKPSLLILLSSLLIVLGILFFSTRASYNERLINGYRILQASFNDEWDEVIQLSKDPSLINNLAQTKINRALYEKGNLLDDLFNYPQKFGEKGIFLDAMASSYVAVHTSDFYYDLGFALETRHWATEAQMIMVRHPLVLKHLVMSYIAIGQEKAALKYLEVLSGSRNYRDWCDHIYTMLETDSAVEDPDIKFFRDNNPAVDFFAGTINPVVKLKKFYSSNKSNQMAFEFLVAGNLLKHNIGAVLSLLPDFERYGYENFPRAVEEALMIYVARTRDSDKLLSSYSISSGTVERFKDFNSLLANVDSKTERMRRVSKYGNTYWYYVLFNSPYARKK